jgi:sugar phosphate isomerase/epimerase
MEARLAGMVEGIERLAPLTPDTVFFVSGPAGDLSERRAREVVIDALRMAADAAREAGSRVALEPMREEARADWTIVTSLRDALELLEDVDRDDVGILFDTWHMWDSPDVHEILPSAVERMFGVQIADYRDPTRGPRDRVAAGDGVADIPRLLAELRGAGYDGWYDMEVFSDDGRFGYAYPDSLWALGPEEFARRQIAGFLRCWEASG